MAMHGVVQQQDQKVVCLIARMFFTKLTMVYAIIATLNVLFALDQLPKNAVNVMQGTIDTVLHAQLNVLMGIMRTLYFQDNADLVRNV